MTSAQLSMGSVDDGTLARAAAAGDRAAFAAIYDRYADRLHDFCIGMLRDRDAAADCVQDVFVTAATKLTQLREPERLRPWLYAVARSQALARIRERKREQVSEELPEMPSGEADMDTMAARTELADLIRVASGGLSDRDQVVLELAYRQGLDGPELADALGVTPKNANTLVERLRDTIARSLGALLVCRRTAADPDRCPELAAILDGWDGKFTVLMRKRVARHIDGCAICEEERARMVSPAALLGATPMVIPAPAWLRERTLERAVVPGPDAHFAPSGPEDESWWPPKDFDADDSAGHAGSGQSGSAVRRRGGRAGVGAALVLLGVGAAAVLAAPAALRVAPADSPAPLTSSPTSTVVTTTPSLAQRPAPSDTPTTLPPAMLTTTTAVVAPTTETTDESPPPSTPAPASAPEPPPTSNPITTTSRPVTTRPRPITEEPTEPKPVTSPPAPEPGPEQPPSPPPSPPSSPKKPPTFTMTKVPPKQVQPNCPQSDPTCQGGGPIIG